MAYVTSTISGAPSEQFTVDRDEMRIGRHPECDIVVDAGAVSRFHAKLVRVSGGVWTVEDLGSRNGTFVNNHLQQQVPDQEPGAGEVPEGHVPAR